MGKLMSMRDFKVADNRSDFEVRQVLVRAAHVRTEVHTAATWRDIFTVHTAQTVDAPALVKVSGEMRMVRETLPHMTVVARGASHDESLIERGGEDGS